MRFKTWIEEYENQTATFSSLDQKADDFFRNASKMNIPFDTILNALGLPKSNTKPKIIGKGTKATVYSNPHNPQQVIKLTSDRNDAKNFNNLLKKRFLSPNVAKCYGIAKAGPNAYAMLLDYVSGNAMRYTNEEFTTLIQGDNFTDYQEAILELNRAKFGKSRMRIFQNHNVNPLKETMKLVPLFRTLSQMEKFGIDLFDFDQNIIDNGTTYILVDLGQ